MDNRHSTCLALWKHHVNLLSQKFRSCKRTRNLIGIPDKPNLYPPPQLNCHFSRHSMEALIRMIHLSNCKRYGCHIFRTNDKGKIDVSSKGPSSGVSSGARGKPRVFLYELIQKHHVTK